MQGANACRIKAHGFFFLLCLERIGKLKNFLLLKEIYNRNKVITTISFGKRSKNLNASRNDSIAVENFKIDAFQYC
jgi:hypothetical protein